MSAPTDKPSRVWPALLVALIAAALPYLTAMRQPFVYDDIGTIVENPFLQQPDVLKRTLTLRAFADPNIVDAQRPAVILSYLMDHALWGLNPAGYRATSLALHLAAVALVFLLGRTIMRRTLPAFIAALIFALHPVLVEAVHAPAFREDLIAAVFAMLFLLLSLQGRLWSALPALAIALLAKESAVVAPLLLGLIWLFVPDLRPVRRNNALRGMYFPFLLVATFVVVSFASHKLQAMGGSGNGLSLAFPQNLYTSPWLFALDLRLLLVPYPLSVDYVVTPVAYPFALRFCAGLFAVVALAAGAWLFRKTKPAAAVGLGWLLIAFLPVSSLVPLFNPLADRYLYLPAVGFALAAGCLLDGLRRRAWVVALLAAILAGLTMLRLDDWQSSERLWTRTLEVEPRSARAHVWLGIEANGRHDVASARRHMEEALKVNPREVTALINLGVYDAQAGDLDAAIRHTLEAIKLRPERADGWWNYAELLAAKGLLNESSQIALRAASLNPTDPRAVAIRAAADTQGIVDPWRSGSPALQPPPARTNR